MSRLLISALVFMCALGGAMAQTQKKGGKGSAYGEIAGFWRGHVQYLNHNSRYPQPKYFKVSPFALSIDKTGHVIGRSDNGCAMDGQISPMQLNAPAFLDVMVYRCPDPEFNRRMTGTLNKHGELLMSWEMRDEHFPVVVRISGVLGLVEGQ